MSSPLEQNIINLQDILNKVNELPKSGNSNANVGDALNFTVVGGTTTPTNPTQNTIWVNTSTTITGWMFSANEPTNIANGTVWFMIGTSSVSEFNAVKNNMIQVYPYSAKQYVSGEWVEVESMTYQNGEWVGWFTYLYNNGDVCYSLTKDYIKLTYDAMGSHTAVTEMRNDCIYLHGGYHAAYYATTVGMCTVEKIDFSNIKRIYISGNCTKATDPATLQHDGNAKIGLRLLSSQNANSIVAEVYTYKTGDFELSIDTSNLNDSYYVFPFVLGYSGYLAEGTISKIWCK